MWRTPSLLLLAVFFVSIVLAPAAASPLQTADALVETELVENIEEGMALLQEHLQTYPEDGHALWRLAKAHLYLGDRMEDSILETYERGLEYAEQAVELVPDSPDAHYWQASLMGRVGQTRGVLNSLAMVSPMRAALERALEIDPDYASAYYVLSLLYKEAPGWPISIGSRRRSLENAQTAVELSPRDPEFRYNLADIHVYNNNPRQAIQNLEYLLDTDYIHDYPDIKESAQTLLAELTE